MVDKSRATSQWEMMKDLYDRASDLPPASWSEFLASECADVEMRAEVYRLLSLSDPAANFFSSLAREVGLVEGPPQTLEVGQELGGRFRIQAFIAAGGMGEVYEAEDLELGGRVALKLMKSSVSARLGSLQRFRDEIRLARTISDPHVCRVLDVARDGDMVFFTMELLRGQTLAAILHERGALPLDEARALIRQMALGLDAAHRAGVIHRDFKSGNVIVCEGPRAVITDFGLARAVDHVPGSPEGATPAYVAPEQLRAEPESPRTDIYSFGVVLFEMLTGTLPFDGINSLETARIRLHQSPRFPRKLRQDLPASWEPVLLKCLELDPARRYASPLEVARALGCLDEKPAVSRRDLLIGAAGLIPGAAALAWYRSRGRTTAALSIAVLPFESSDASIQFLADGIADRLTDALTKVPGLQVISRSAAKRVNKREDAGRLLNVRYLFTGKVSKSGPRLHVTGEIVDSATGFQAWAGTEDIDPAQAEVLSVTLSKAAIQSLKIEAQPADLSAMDRPLTSSAEAYQLYLLGRYHAERRSRDSLAESVSVLERAVTLDPNFTAAWAALGYAYFELGIRSGDRQREPLTRAQSCAEQALRLDGQNAEAYLVLGAVKHRWLWDWAGAEADFRKSVQLNAKSPVAHRLYAILLAYTGRNAEALREADAAMALDPLSPAMGVLRGVVLSFGARYDEAVAQFERVIAADPAYENVYVPYADALERKGRLSEAITAADRAVAQTHGASFALSVAGRMYGIRGDSQKAGAILSELLDRNRRGQATAGEIAPVYAGLGRNADALTWLEDGFSKRDQEMLALPVALEYLNLRSEPRFQQLLSKMKYSN